MLLPNLFLTFLYTALEIFELLVGRTRGFNKGSLNSSVTDMSAWQKGMSSH